VDLVIPERSLEEICQEWNRRRGRVVPRRAVHRHAERLRGSLDLLEGEGFEVVHVLRAPDEIDRARVVRAPSG
jgi:predicted kinase